MSTGSAFFKPFQLQNTDECSDCKADLTLAEVQPGLWRMTIAHDNSCPWLRNHEQKVTRR